VINIPKPKDDKAQPEPKKEPESQPPDYGKQIEELKSGFEKTISEQGKTIEQLQEYVTGSSVVINTIAADQSLRTAFQEAIKKQYSGDVPSQQPPQGQPQNQNNQPPQNQNADVTKKVDDVVSSQREQIIREFESVYGIKGDEGKDSRQKIAEYLSGFGWSVKDLPLTNLRDSLEKAYIGSVGVEKLREEGKLEGIATMRNNQMGTMGSFSGSAPQASEQTGELTSKQQEWLKKLRVKDVEGAKKLYNERDQEETREKVVEDK